MGQTERETTAKAERVREKDGANNRVGQQKQSVSRGEIASV